MGMMCLWYRCFYTPWGGETARAAESMEEMRPMMYPRDFQGYGPIPPDPQWPSGARVAVSLVVNIEEGAELSLCMGDERNEGIYEVVDEIKGVPDPCHETSADRKNKR